MHASVIDTGQQWLKNHDVGGRNVLEVGAFDVNGSIRPYIESLKPFSYVGTDMRPGPGVDVVCDATELEDYFGPTSFGVVISTEMLEHALDWRAAISNMKRVVRPDGLIYLTTRSVGFPLHDYPSDHWRFSVKGMEEIFSDFVVEGVKSDPQAAGVFVLARRPFLWTERDLTSIEPHRMV